MEVALILCLFGGLLYLRFSLACVWDYDCPYTRQSCCKYTETGKRLSKGLCVSRTCGAGVCRTHDDCLTGKEYCDTSSSFEFRCETVCYDNDLCRQIYGQDSGYICTYSEVIGKNQCVSQRNSDRDSMSDTDSDMDTTRFILISCGVIGFCLIVVCLRRWRRRGQSTTGMASRPALLSERTNAQERRNVERPAESEMTFIQIQAKHSNGPTLDAIAVSGPPSYMEVGDMPESPPPTYEEVTKV